VSRKVIAQIFHFGNDGFNSAYLLLSELMAGIYVIVLDVHFVVTKRFNYQLNIFATDPSLHGCPHAIDFNNNGFKHSALLLSSSGLDPAA
jgi:hypothetical protein